MFVTTQVARDPALTVFPMLTLGNWLSTSVSVSANDPRSPSKLSKLCRGAKAAKIAFTVGLVRGVPVVRAFSKFFKIGI